MKRWGYFLVVLFVSTFAVTAASPKACADTSSQAEIAALKTQIKEMAMQQKKAAAVIEKLAAEVDKLQNQISVQTSKVSDIQKQQFSQATQDGELARVEPAAGGHDGGAYLGLFGGWGAVGDSTAHQLGTVFFPEVSGGPLSVNATGRAKTGGTGFVGAQAGYEWSYGSRLLPAVEIEALYLPRTRQHATLVNQNPRIPEHIFNDTMSTGTSVILANAVVGFRTPYKNITPYVGGGIGAAYLSVNGASSAQLSPAEPGINHFNTNHDSSVLTAAAQLKAGLRMALSDSVYLFGEYRYLYVGANDQTFGPAMYGTHAPTSPWTISYDGTSYNLATVGVGYHF